MRLVCGVFEGEWELVGAGGEAYHFEDEGDYLVGLDMAVVLKQVADCRVDCFHGWRVPAYVLVAGADLGSSRNGRCGGGGGGGGGEGFYSGCHDGCGGTVNTVNRYLDEVR